MAAFGGRDVARSLPQDEATAVVVLGAMLARHLDKDTWPGEYRAVVRGEGAFTMITEDDLRVASVRTLLLGVFTVECGCLVRRDFTAAELEAARCAVLAAGRSESEPAAGHEVCV